MLKTRIALFCVSAIILTGTGSAYASQTPKESVNKVQKPVEIKTSGLTKPVEIK